MAAALAHRARLISRPVGTRVQLAAFAAVGAISAVLLLVATRMWGLGVTYDSVAYMQASHRLSVALPQPRDHGGLPLYWWGPIYPLALKVVGSSYSNARFLSAAILFVGVTLIGWIATRAMGFTAGLTAAALYAFSPAVFDAHLNLLAESLYLVLATTCLALIARRQPALSGLTAGISILTRYAGLPLIITGLIAYRGRERLKFLATSVAVYGAWMVRNVLAAHQTTGRQLRWHPMSRQLVTNELRAALHVVVTPGRLPSIHLPVIGAGRAVELVIGAAVLVAISRAELHPVPRIVKVALVYAGAYLIFLVATVSLFDAGTPVDERLLVPIAPTVVLALAWLTKRTPIIAALIVCLFGIAVLQQVRTVSLYGIDYSGRIWKPARLDGVRLPPGVLYSNLPAAVAYFAGRSPRRIPQTSDPHTLDVSQNFPREIRDLVATVKAGHAGLVIFDSTKFLEVPSLDPGVVRALAALGRDCQRSGDVIIVCKAA